MQNRLIVTTVSVLFLSFFAFAGHGQATKASKNGGDRIDPKLDKGKPGVFIDQPPSGPMGTDANDLKNVWLRLNNNLIWDISLCVYDSADAKRGIVGLHYDLVKTPKSVFDIEFSDSDRKKDCTTSIPRGIPTTDICDEHMLKSGQSLLFKVSREHFLKDARIRVIYYYPWENVYNARIGREPQHSVYFYSRSLAR